MDSGGNASMTRSTEIRSLDARHLTKLAQILCVQDDWTKLAEHIPRSAADPSPLYNVGHIIAIGNSKGNPAEFLLRDWGTHGKKGERPTIDLLVKFLLQLEMYRAAYYLCIYVLKDEPPAGNYQMQTTEEELRNIWTYGQTSFPSLPALKDADKGSDDVITGDPFASVRSVRIDRPQWPSRELSSGSNNDLNSEMAMSASNLIINEQSFVNDTPNQPYEQQQQQLTSGIIDSINLPQYPFKYLFHITNGFYVKSKKDGGNLLGEGAFGIVFYGVDEKKPSPPVAVKKLNDSKINTTVRFWDEVKALSTFNHTSLLRLLGFSIDGPFSCLVYEYMSNGTLQDKLARLDDVPGLPWKLRLSVAAETAQGLAYLHLKQYVHRDVKSANILLDDHFNAKLGDFGIMRTMSLMEKSSEMTVHIIGTSAYMPKEAFDGSISPLLDTYSFGMVLLELLTGLKPMVITKDDAEDLSSYTSRKCLVPEDIITYIDPYNEGWDEVSVVTLYNLARECLAYNKHFRPAIMQITPKLQELVRSCSHQD